MSGTFQDTYTNYVSQKIDMGERYKSFGNWLKYENDCYKKTFKKKNAEFKRLQKLIEPLEAIGLIDTSGVRSSHVGSSNYSKHVIQPWSIWMDYKLNPWDADIVKRTLRTKTLANTSPTQARIEDYKKIKHVCDERIRQLEIENDLEIKTDEQDTAIKSAIWNKFE